MATGEHGHFTCEFCGKPYPWKPQLAGKKVRCECGEVMVAPDQPNAAPRQSADDLGEYNLADEPQPASPKQPTPSRSASTPLSPILAPQPDAKASEQTAARADFANRIGGSPWREIHLPTGLVVLGLILNIMLFMRMAGGEASVSRVLLPLGLTLLLNLILSMIGVLLVSKWFEIGFGHPGTALLKLSAVILVPASLAGFAALALGSTDVWTVMGVRLIIVMPLTLIGLVALFSLALDEAFYCTSVIYLVTQWATLFLVSPISMEQSESTAAPAMILQSGTQPAGHQTSTTSPAP